MRRVELDGGVYTRKSVAAAAQTLSGRAEVNLPRAWGQRPAVTLRALDKTSPAELEAELLDEALSCLYRHAVAVFNESASRPILAAAIERRLRPPIEDHLERMEPDVARDRRLEVETLMKKASE